jgi:peptidoglycan/xylan/chitin deacetylase (PgdA/CDA1 family)
MVFSCPKSAFFSAVSLALFLSLLACQPAAKSDTGSTAAANKSADNQLATTSDAAAPTAASAPAGPVATAAQVIARREVPILCYHQVRDWRGSDSKGAKDYIIPVAAFRAQMQMLADSGYHTVLPDQLLAYLTTGAALPTKPVMLTFDDTDLDQYTVAAPELEKHGYKGVFFIMTVSIGRHGRQPYMDATQIKDLADRGHVIASHTWDHHNVKKYAGDDWRIQVEEPTAKLAQITGKPIRYFAYPFGLWNPPAIPELKKRGMIAAFQLADKRDPTDPLHTIRRIIASGYWSAKTLHTSMVQSFNKQDR